MNKFKELWLDKHTQHGRIDITLFFVNIFLIMVHIFLMVIYIIVDHKFMMCVNVLSLILYITFIFRCYKKPLRYAGLAFLEIWIHMICAVSSFGLEPCFQNWSFAIVSGYFFPVFGLGSEKKSYKTTFFYTGIVVVTYFAIVLFSHSSIIQPLDSTMNSILFIVNNLITFFTIIMFAIFYTYSTQRRTRELTRKADYDELTNLYNRYSLNQIYRDMISKDEKPKTYSVAILDIDDFKKINDEYGHNSGDMVLIEFAEILRFYSIKGIKVGRWGGEEFVIIAPSEVRYSEFVNVLERIRLKISRTKFKTEDEKEINVTASIGSTKVKDKNNLSDALIQADKNMYRAKITGKNKVIS